MGVLVGLGIAVSVGAGVSVAVALGGAGVDVSVAAAAAAVDVASMASWMACSDGLQAARISRVVMVITLRMGMTFLAVRSRPRYRQTIASAFISSAQ